MRTLEQQATVLRHAVRQALVDLDDAKVPVRYRVQEAREALEAFGVLADRMLAGVMRRHREARPRPAARQPRVVH